MRAQLTITDITQFQLGIFQRILKLITIADMFRESIITNKNPHKLVNSKQSILHDCFTLLFVSS